jgi:hypothetical protein
MQKGQLSIDLLVTLILVLIIISGIALVISTYSTSADNLTITQQLNYGASNTAALITTTQAISDSKFTIDLKINKINYTDERKNNKLEYPNISIIDENTILFSKTVRGTTYTASAPFYKTPDTNINTSLASTNGILVISNE